MLDPRVVGISTLVDENLIFRRPDIPDAKETERSSGLKIYFHGAESAVKFSVLSFACVDR